MAQGTRTSESGGSSARSDYAAVEKDVQELKEDVKKLTDTLEKIVKSRAEQGREEVSAKYDAAKRRAEDLRDQADDKLNESLLHARSTVANRPLTSMSAALGLGVVLGLLLRRH